MHVLAAPDKFRGSLSASQVARAISVGAKGSGWSCQERPLADGGEGTLDAFGGANRASVVLGPLGDPVEAGWRLDGATGVIEMAQASGLSLAGGREANDPVAATSFGTGQLIAEAVSAGATEVIVGVGGSASTDGGCGAVEALRAVSPFAEHGVSVSVACDVETRFVDAAAVFGPQKGANDDQIQVLAERLQTLRRCYRSRFGIDVAELPGSGAAGGLAGGLAALGAVLASGFELVAQAVDLEAALALADVVVTGEGSVDATSFAGKVVGGVVARAAAAGIPAVIVAGSVDAAVVAQTCSVSLVARFGEERAWAETELCIAEAVSDLLSEVSS